MAITRIEKLIDFAKDGQKSIQGLALDLGFPRDEKPARAWFNYLFNKSFGTINLLIDEIDILRAKVDYLEIKDNIVIIPPLIPDPIEPTPPQNKVGEWTVTIPPRKLSWNATPTLNQITLQHSSGEKVGDVEVSATQIRLDGYRAGTTITDGLGSTSDSGAITRFLYASNRPDSYTKMEVTIKAPNTETLVRVFDIWDGVPYSSTGGSGGGNANQTE